MKVLASIKKKKRQYKKGSFKHEKNMRYYQGKEKIGYVNILKKCKEETKVQQIPTSKGGYWWREEDTVFFEGE